MNPLTVAAGAGVLGVLAAGWGRIKSVLARIRSLLIVRAVIQPQPMMKAMAAWCWTNCRRSRWGDRRFFGFWLYLRGADRSQLVPLEDISSQSVVFWKGLRPLWVARKVEKSSSGDAPSSAGEDPSITISFIRGTFSLEQLLLDASALYTERHSRSEGQRRFCIYRLFGKGPPEARASRENKATEDEETVSSSSGRPMGELQPLGVEIEDLQWDAWTSDSMDPTEVLAFPPDVEAVMEEAERWLASKRWYGARGIPWRRGWLLQGVPGTGKTSLARAVAWKLDLPVFCFDLSGMSNQELVRHWRKIAISTPCIALIEDLDAVFDGRKNLVGRSGGGLTFDCLLNCISGIQSSDGVFLIVTTNNGQQLDAAMVRAGRLDRTVTLEPMGEDCRRRVATRILRDAPNLINDAVGRADGLTAAMFTEHCARLALTHYWATRKPSEGAEQ